MKRVLILLCLGLMVTFGIAAASASAMADTSATPTAIVRDGVTLTIAQEKRAEAIGNKLRCLVCQNETVENSRAGLAKQFRGIIRRRVVRGETDKQIIAFMVKRYGIFVLLKPPLIPLTWLLWFSPAIALLAGLGVVLLARRRTPSGPAPDLTETERARLKDILS